MRGQQGAVSRFGPFESLLDDIVAKPDAIIANIDPRTGDEFIDVGLALSAEGAEQSVEIVVLPRHGILREIL
jgi:hypothetical protein